MKDSITAEPTTKKIKPSERPHYVNNAQFSQAIVDYVILAKAAKAKDKPLPQLSEYIGTCLLKIAEGLDVETLPAEFVRVIKSVDAEAVRAALEAGEDVKFATLEARGTHLRIK